MTTECSTATAAAVHALNPIGGGINDRQGQLLVYSLTSRSAFLLNVPCTCLQESASLSSKAQALQASIGVSCSEDDISLGSRDLPVTQKLAITQSDAMNSQDPVSCTAIQADGQPLAETGPVQHVRPDAKDKAMSAPAEDVLQALRSMPLAEQIWRVLR